MYLQSNNHSVFKLHYHLIMCIKYRKKIIDNFISSRLKDIFDYISPKYNISLNEYEHDYDHIHCLLSAHPNSEISKFINAYKSASSRLIKKEFPIIRKKLWKEYFWSRSFCLITVRGTPLEVLKSYIQNQRVV
ncbi:MAG: IS200/IS605 family transposase [Anaplasmataceae bacterium]|nr:IS200/IS605 family transposase [Anaplasmataceae bacterium]